MPPISDVGSIVHAIQLAIAPVFLLTGLASLLGVMANRLARVIDRARTVEAAWPAMDRDAQTRARQEMTNLERRRRLCSWSINCCTMAALLVCLVIVTLFAGEFFTANLSWLAGYLFVAVMVLLSAGLSVFLREVYLATHMNIIDHARLKMRE